MDLRHRKLPQELNISSFPPCPFDCFSDACGEACKADCPQFCYSLFPPSIPTPSVPSVLDDQSTEHHKASVSVPFIASLTVLSCALLLVFCFAAFIIYSRYYSGRQTSRTRRQPQTGPSPDEFPDDDDDDDGPVDHPIWYIRTVGLQSSIISSIAVYKYKKGEGLVEGSDCSVCLNEFQEDETLRLLPKCNHAFHVPCIDTWLRSHTNCPMCRAPIVKSTVQAPPPEPNVNNLRPGEEIQEGNSQSSRGSGRNMADSVPEVRIVIEEEAELSVGRDRRRSENSNDSNHIKPVRRSVSMDSLPASKINLAIANPVPARSDLNSHSLRVKALELNSRIGPKRVEGNQNSVRSSGSSSKGRSLPTGPLSMKRSFSGRGRFMLRNYSQKAGTVIRSF